MRMWNVNPKILCNSHMLGEHVEMHFFLGWIKKGKSIKGFIEKGLVEVHNIKKRHDELAEEMIKRGMNHKSPMEDYNFETAGYVNIQENLKELKKRCNKCCYLIEFDETVSRMAKEISDDIDNQIIQQIIEESERFTDDQKNLG